MIFERSLSGLFGGPAFIQPIRAIEKAFKKLWLAREKPALQKTLFCFGHMNRLIILLWCCIFTHHVTAVA